jgi:hypothetical protein
VSKELFDKVSESIMIDHPSLKIKYKDESFLMKLLSLLIYPFNQRFADGYVTTLGSTVYFPSRFNVSRDWKNAAEILAHEGVHVYDNEKHPIWFKLSYALNQFAIIPMVFLFAIIGSWIPVVQLIVGLFLAYLSLNFVKKMTDDIFVQKISFFIPIGIAGIFYIILSLWFSGWMTILAIAVFVPLIPFSSKLRAEWEYRGYAMGIAMHYWMYRSVPDSLINRMVEIFNGPDYYYMDRSKSRVATRLDLIKSSVTSGAILTGEDSRPYRRTFEVLNQLKMIKAANA